jgi:hypothetical protein
MAIATGRTPAAASVRGWRTEVALFALAYLVYVASRWIFTGQPGPARANAAWIWELEQSTGLAVEADVQRALSSPLADWLLGNVYLAAQFAVLPAALLWTYRRSRRVYERLRTTVIATWMLSVPLFALFPVAPPRLADLGAGFADTVSDQAAVALTGASTIFYNPYAAVPSLHVGFAFALGIAGLQAARAPWARLLAALWGPLVALTVVATANHYLFDVAAGLAVTAAGAVVGRLLTRRATTTHRPAAMRGTTRTAARPATQRTPPAPAERSACATASPTAPPSATTPR